MDSYATLLRLAKLGEDRDDVADRTYTPQSSDSLEILSASANIVRLSCAIFVLKRSGCSSDACCVVAMVLLLLLQVHSCQLLLERVHELKLQVLLQDFAGIDQEVDEQHQVLNER